MTLTLYKRAFHTAAANQAVKIATIACALLLPMAGWSQIGGKTSADGPFTLENAEDLDTTATGVNRAWIADKINSDPGAFQSVSLPASGLTPASEQSPLGALRYRMPTSDNLGYIDYTFGVPMPSEPGESTLTHPGDISSFTHLTFLVSSSHDLLNQVNQVILETYPGPNYPKLYWNYQVQAGTAFQRVTLDLRTPTFTQNTGALSITDLLSQTRFLAFYFYGGQEITPKTFTVHVDDIKLTAGASSVDLWTLY